MGVDISHRNLVRLSTADDVCSRRKESGENLPGSWGDGKEGSSVETGGDRRLGVCCGCHGQILQTLNVLSHASEETFKVL